MRVRDSLRTLEREGSGRKTEEVVAVETVPASHILVKPLQMSCSVYPENWATKGPQRSFIGSGELWIRQK